MEVEEINRMNKARKREHVRYSLVIQMSIERKGIQRTQDRCRDTSKSAVEARNSDIVSA